MKKFLVGFVMLVFSLFSAGTYSFAAPINQAPGQQGGMSFGQQGGMPFGQGQSEKLQTSNTSSAQTESVISIYINGAKQSFSANPVTVNESILMPMRSLFEALGSSVEWENATQTVTGKRGNTSVKLSIGNKQAFINGGSKELNAPPQLINSNTYIPLRFVSEAYGAKVEWKDGAVYIQMPEDNIKSNNSLEIIKDALNNTFKDAGDTYFDNGNINCAITLSGNKTDLQYAVALGFDDTDDYDALSDLSEPDIKSFLNALKAEITTEIDGTYYKDAYINGILVDSDDSSIYVKYYASSYTFSWNEDSDISNIESTLNDYFDNAGYDYFDDSEIEISISLDGDEDDFVYDIEMDFSDSSDYDDLTDLSTSDIKSFLNAVKTKITREIDWTDYEDADIIGRLVDNDNSDYFVKYDGSSYNFSWK